MGVALIVNERGLRPKLLALAAVAVAGAAIVLSTGFLSMAPMDAAWLSTLADKDYVFPNDWAPATWAVNLLYPVVIGASFLVRQRLGLALPAERGVVVGCLSLVAAFLAALPFIAAGIAAFVQLQVSRVFWMADALSAAYIAWWLCEARWERGLDRGGVPRLPGAAGSWRPILVTALLVAAASARGWYVLAVEHPGRPLVQVTFPDDAWQDVSTWLQRHTPKNAHLLADPGHAFLYGFSLRVTAARDVFLENVKDGSIAMSDRQVAMRVAERRAALGDFADLTGPRAQDLAARYDLQCLVSERPLPLPGALPQPAVPGVPPPALKSLSIELPPYIASRRWSGGHRMTVYAWARRRAFPRLPPPESRYFDVGPDSRVLAHVLLAARADGCNDPAGAPRARGLESAPTTCAGWPTRRTRAA